MQQRLANYNDVKVQGWRERRSEIRVGVGADDTPEYGDIRGWSKIEGQSGRQLASAYKGLSPFGAAFAWISE